MNIRRSAFVLGLAALSFSGAAMSETSKVGQFLEDSTITTEVKAKFAKSPAVAATSISVETLGGTVQLTGFAKNESEKTNAEALARQVSGVKEVKNDIIVKP